MDWFAAQDYEIARQVLQRGVAGVFVVAFLSTAAQFPALLGEHGLLPVPRLLEHRRFLRGPTLFRWRYSDRLLRWVAWTGVALAASVVVGLPQSGLPWVPMLVFLALWLLYMSVVNVGQTFYAFGWEMLLLEAGFTVAFLGSDAMPPPTAILLLTAWLVFRLEFGAGMIKIRGDPAWRDLSALYYHHETQPMPNPLSRFAHLLPKPVHRLEVLGNHFSQLIVPFFLFAPQPIASAAAAVIILTQLWLVVSGNFAWLNWITIVLAFSRISDPVVHWALPFLPREGGSGTVLPIWWLVPVLAVSALLVVLSYWPIRNLFSRRQLMNASFNRWQLVNAYGAFGTVTRRRIEVIVEGTLEASPDDTAEWREYQFKGKPGDPARMPRQFAPYHLRLDWLMWFLPLGSVREEWFYAFLGKLLEADRSTLRMLRVDPFDGERPSWVRVRTFHYRFATRAEKRRTGLWWMRDQPRVVIPPVSLP
ncbi:lipase maturation factor family protein [Leifsonia bigeumensis]|uniref:Lipase maturation factor family protein n=1 Tax=Leifsonella bigeumensis TaxID=433643 RepID=A0ABP7F171_9MICO